MKFEDIKIGDKEFINLGWGYILVKDSGVSFGDTSCKAIAQKIKGCSRFYEGNDIRVYTKNVANTMERIT